MTRMARSSRREHKGPSFVPPLLTVQQGFPISRQADLATPRPGSEDSKKCDCILREQVLLAEDAHPPSALSGKGPWLPFGLLFSLDRRRSDVDGWRRVSVFSHFSFCDLCLSLPWLSASLGVLHLSCFGPGFCVSS